MCHLKKKNPRVASEQKLARAQRYVHGLPLLLLPPVSLAPQGSCWLSSGTPGTPTRWSRRGPARSSSRRCCSSRTTSTRASWSTPTAPVRRRFALIAFHGRCRCCCACPAVPHVDTTPNFPSPPPGTVIPHHYLAADVCKRQWRAHSPMLHLKSCVIIHALADSSTCCTCSESTRNT